MKIGIIIPTYPGEKRVALLPEHMNRVSDDLLFEVGFGEQLGLSDESYKENGGKFETRENIFKICDVIFCLKLLQKQDYKFLRKNQIIIGWTHPTGSGTYFYENVAKEKNLKIFDLDNIYPRLFCQEKSMPIPFLPKNFIWKNSFNAGVGSVSHALLSMGMYLNSDTKVAVLANGSVSQGAYNFLAKFNVDMRMFYRKTMQEFKDSISEYDVIVNGIEVEDATSHIISKYELKKVKKGCLIIDSAADAGNAIEGTCYTTIDNPIYEDDGVFFYEVNNAPSVLYRKSSFDISDSLTTYVFNEDIDRFIKLVDEL